MSKALDRFTYTFGEITLEGTRRGTRYQTTWYLKCPECKGNHQLHQTGSKVWHTSCEASSLEWVITPKELFITKPLDFTLILGEENGKR